MDQPPYTTYPPGPDFAGLTRRIALAGPEPFLFTGEDALQIDSFGSIVGVTLTVSGVMLSEGLQLLPFSFTHTPSSNRTLVTTRTSVGSGWLQHLRVTVSTGAPLVGQVFVFARACRGTTSVALPLGTIVSGYMTGNSDLFWPGVSPASPLDGAGAIRSIVGTAPGLGAEILETVPTGARWEVISFQATLTTSGVAGNRTPTLKIDDGVNIFFRVSISQNETSGATWFNNFSEDIPVTVDAGNKMFTVPIPSVIGLIAGSRIGTSTAGLLAGDQYAAPVYLVRERLEV